MLAAFVAAALGVAATPGTELPAVAAVVVWTWSAVGLSAELDASTPARFTSLAATLGVRLEPAVALSGPCRMRPSCIALAVNQADARGGLVVSALRVGPSVRFEWRLVSPTADLLFERNEVLSMAEVQDERVLGERLSVALKTLPELRVALPLARDPAPGRSRADAGQPAVVPIVARPASVSPADATAVGRIETRREEPDSAHRGALLTIAAGGVVALIGGGVLGLGFVDKARVEHAKLGTAWRDVSSSYDRAPRAMAAGAVSLGLGAAAAAVGLAWLTSSRVESTQATVAGSPNAAMLAVTGRF